jgi:hypothetical protein
MPQILVGDDVGSATDLMAAMLAGFSSELGSRFL